MTDPQDDCPMLLLLDRLADKWTVRVMSTLCEQPMRFNALRRSVGGISQKMLSQTLRGLVRDGLVRREVTPTVPITVEYFVTPLGETLAETVHALRIWSEEHLDDVSAARAAYDTDSGAKLTPIKVAA